MTHNEMVASNSNGLGPSWLVLGPTVEIPTYCNETSTYYQVTFPNNVTFCNHDDTPGCSFSCYIWTFVHLLGEPS